MRGAKFLGHTAKRRKKTGRCKPSGPLCRFHGELPPGCPRCAVLVAPPSLRGSCCAASAGLESMPFPPPLSVAPPRCVVPVVAPLRRILRAGEHAGSASPLRFPSPLRRPVALFPLSPRCAPPVGLEITPLPCAVPPPLGWSLRVAFVASCCAAPCRAAGFIAWRPAPDRSAGPRCRAPCGRCPPRSPTR